MAEFTVTVENLVRTLNIQKKGWEKEGVLYMKYDYAKLLETIITLLLEDIKNNGFDVNAFQLADHALKKLETKEK